MERKMSRLKFVLPAAAMLLAGAVTASTAQAAPTSGLPEALKAAQSQTAGNVQKAHWRRHHHRHHYRHHHRRHHHHHRHHRHW
jgi:ribulose kinase